jgi:hypothetical protein
MVPAAWADLTYTMSTNALTMDPPRVILHRISLGADRMALASSSDGNMTRFVFRGDKKVLWMIDDPSHAYMQIDEASVKALTASIGPSLEYMQEKMAQLPPHQRAEMEKILHMEAKGAAKPKPVVAVTNTGQKEKIEGYDCTRWDVTHDGTKTAEVWATSWKAARASKADFAVLEQLTAFLAVLHEASPATRNLSRPGDLVSEMDRVDGFPVRIRQFEDGMLASESTLEAVDGKKVDAATFEVPAGYEQKEFGPPGR